MPIIAVGEKTNASPIFSSTISLKITFKRLSLPVTETSGSTGSLALLFNVPCVTDAEETAPTCRSRLLSHSGEVNLCTMMTEAKSSSASETVGSCVDTRIRVPRCL